MFDRIWTYVKSQLVAEPPDALAACLDCSAIACSGEGWRVCLDRLARTEELAAWKVNAGAQPPYQPGASPG